MTRMPRKGFEVDMRRRGREMSRCRTVLTCRIVRKRKGRRKIERGKERCVRRAESSSISGTLPRILQFFMFLTLRVLAEYL